jgi:geranylgeranyl diphosphate synthase type II
MLTLSSLKDALDQGRAVADAALERLLPPETQRPASIHKAMRHSVFAGGKCCIHTR